MFYKLKLFIAFFLQYPSISIFPGLFLSSVFIITPLFLSIARSFFSSSSREYTPSGHQKKDKTPTMGGIVIGIVLCLFVWLLDIVTIKTRLLLFCYFLFASIGSYDDFCKIYKKRGISAKTKFGAQVISATIAVFFWFFTIQPNTECVIPFFNYTLFDWGYFFIPWSIFIIVACSNAVNITDGLDGLATVVVLPGLFLSAVMAFSFLEYEIAFFTISLCVSLVAFLIFNWHPAQLFMGDVGSLPIGAVWALILLILRQELVLPLMGIVSLIEIFSVLIQVFWFKRYKRRVFLMTPLHHHFELLGWHETKITICAGIISVMSCLIIALLFL